MQLGKSLILQPEILLEIDGGADESERFTGDAHIRGRKPPPRGTLDVVRLAGGGVVERPWPELGPRRCRHEHCGQPGQRVQTNSKYVYHNAVHSPEEVTGPAGKALSE